MAVDTSEVAMVTQMEMQVMEILVGETHHKLLQIMVVRLMALMVGKLAMVVGIAVLRHDKPSSSNFDDWLFN